MYAWLKNFQESEAENSVSGFRWHACVASLVDIKHDMQQIENVFTRALKVLSEISAHRCWPIWFRIHGSGRGVCTCTNAGRSR